MAMTRSRHLHPCLPPEHQWRDVVRSYVSGDTVIEFARQMSRFGVSVTLIVCSPRRITSSRPTGFSSMSLIAASVTLSAAVHRLRPLEERMPSRLSSADSLCMRTGPNALLDDGCENVGELVQPCARSPWTATAKQCVDALNVTIQYS
jgi:hypothetical protein